MTEFGNKIINLQALDVQTLGHYCYFMNTELKALVDKVGLTTPDNDTSI